MALSAAITAEIQRKAANNIPLSNQTPEAMKVYNAAKSNLDPVNNTTTTATKTTITPAPTAPINNAATSTANPATGYGGATYGTSAAANQAIMANQSKISTDPNFVASEIARTQQVIKEREAQGLDTSSQYKYLTQNLGYNPNAQNTQAGSSGFPMLNMNTIYNPGSFGGYDPTAEEQAYLANQIAGYQGQADAAKLAAQYGIDANKAYLQEQIDALTKQKNVDVDAAQQLQNRRGGFYSGGLDTQLASIDSGYAQNTGALTRDIASRNQQLLDQYGNTANTIAAQISNLQQSAPDILRSRIQDWINNERQYGLDYANMFGRLNGQQTLGAQNQEFTQNLANKQANWGAYMDMVNQTGNLGKGPAQNWSNIVNNAYTGPQSLSGQQFTYGQQQDAIANQLARDNYNLDAMYKNASIANMYADNARQNSSEAFNQFMDMWQATGKAPSDMPAYGVKKGDPYPSSGSSNSGGNSNGTIIDFNQPYTVDTMITYIKKNLPGVSTTVYGPPNPDQKAAIENMILGNPNLSDKQIDELYSKFGITPVK